MPTRKTHFSLPKPPNVTVEKFTPAPPPPASTPAPPREPAKAPADSVAFEPVDFSELENKPLPGYAQPPPPPPAATEVPPLERAIPDSLLKRLERRFAIQRTFTKTLASSRGDLAVECRPRNFDDYLWAIDEISREMAEPTGAALGEAARSTLAKHTSACRCVLKVEGEWTWDVFQLRQEIQAVQPRWTGESAVGLPDFYANVLARRVLDLFRHKLHPDLLFSLESALQQEEEAQPDPPKAT